MVRKWPRPPRRDLLTGMRHAETMLRQMATELHMLPGHVRFGMLRLANRLARMIERSAQ